jgi:hypothetical protein
MLPKNIASAWAIEQSAVVFASAFGVLLALAVPLGRTDVDKAQKQYDSAHFENVVKILRDGSMDTLEANEREQALFLLAVSELALGNQALSDKDFVRLFSEAPDFELPKYTAPKVAAAAEKARKEVPVTIHSHVEGHRVIVCGDGLSRHADVRVVFVQGSGESLGDTAYERPCFASRPSGEPSGYYVTVSSDGGVRASEGSRASPLPFAAEKPPVTVTASSGTPWYKSWITWTIVGVVVAGGAAAVAGVLIYNANQQPGSISVRVTTP